MIILFPGLSLHFVSRILFQQPYESMCGQLYKNMFFFGSNIGVYAYLLLGSEGVFGPGNGDVTSDLTTRCG